MPYKPLGDVQQSLPSLHVHDQHTVCLQTPSPLQVPWEQGERCMSGDWGRGWDAEGIMSLVMFPKGSTCAEGNSWKMKVVFLL